MRVGRGAPCRGAARPHRVCPLATVGGQGEARRPPPKGRSRLCPLKGGVPWILAYVAGGCGSAANVAVLSTAILQDVARRWCKTPRRAFFLRSDRTARAGASRPNPTRTAVNGASATVGCTHVSVPATAATEVGPSEGPISTPIGSGMCMARLTGPMQEGTGAVLGVARRLGGARLTGESNGLVGCGRFQRFS